MKLPRIFQAFSLLAIGGHSLSSSAKPRDRWRINTSSFPTMASNLIRRIASSTQMSTEQGINLNERDSPMRSRYFISDESTYIMPSLSPSDKDSYKVRDMSTNRLDHASRRPDVTDLSNDPYGGEGGTALLVNADVHRHSSLIKTIVPAPSSLLYPPVLYESDSYMKALEFSRIPCKMLDDPSGCYDYNQLFKQSVAGSFHRECDIDKSHNAQKTKCDPLFPAEFSAYRSLRLKENFLLQRPIMLLSPNSIEFTLRNIRSNQHSSKENFNLKF